MEEKHEIIMPSFTTKAKSVNKLKKAQPHLAAQMTVNGIELTIFKGTNPNLAVELAKVMIRYAH
ncbi:MAG: hypothetical protein LKJ51_06435 [Limosilactobacillus sp.]|jgi:hypothetical protein|uniref:hypothetical protein n=1 Tax=Limosilactobacillus sp. TaxID=2773925 RepID=UPI0025C22716|nr:hypothetical protein [Limosilactobacillus sp.]MCI1975539.1 hypothetical protein [Limosilactobacillus sp.]